MMQICQKGAVLAEESSPHEQLHTSALGQVMHGDMHTPRRAAAAIRWYTL